MFNRIKETKEREEFEQKEEEIRIEEEKAEQKRLEDEAKEEETLFTDMTECARSLYEVEKDKRAQVYADHVAQKEKEKEQRVKDLTERRVPNFNSLKEERQGEELEKTKAEAAKYEEVINILKEKYNVNNEESVIEVGYNEPLDELKLKLENALNPFNIKIDQEDKVVAPGEVNLEEKYPLSRGPFGLFCPVIYKEDNWLFYAPEANRRKWFFIAYRSTPSSYNDNGISRKWCDFLY